MRIRIPVDQYESAKAYLDNNGFAIILTKHKSGDEILIVAKRVYNIFTAHHCMFPESLDYIYMKDKFNGRAKMIQIDKTEA
jgi:hypothetical protein